jgi:hypothetical protein
MLEETGLPHPALHQPLREKGPPMFNRLTAELLELTAETRGAGTATLAVNIAVTCCSSSCCACIAFCD